MSRSRVRLLVPAALSVVLVTSLAPDAGAASRHRRAPRPVGVSVTTTTVTGRAVGYAVHETPAVRGRVLTVQSRARGGAWHTVVRLREGRGGWGRTALRFGVSGTYDVRTVLQRRGRHPARLSPTRPVVVTPSTRPLVVAHRGGDESGPRTENTMLAFRGALARGVTALETDVRASAPDPVTGLSRLVLLHDASLVRTTDVTTVFPDRASYAVSSFTPQELDQLHAGRGEPVPALTDVLALAAAHPEVSLRLEAKAPRVEEEMAEEVRAAGLDSATTSDRVVYTSFDAARLDEIRRVDADANVQLTVATGSRDPVGDALGARAQWLSVNRTDVTPALVAQTHRAGLRLIAYTVRDASDTFPLADARVDAVSTDLPGAVRRLFPG